MYFMYILTIRFTVYETQPVASYVTFIWLLNVIKGLNVNWKIIKYDFVYVIHRNFGP